MENVFFISNLFIGSFIYFDTKQIYFTYFHDCFTPALHQLISVWNKFTKYSLDPLRSQRLAFLTFHRLLDTDKLQETSDSASRQSDVIRRETSANTIIM